jgi:hypothetical protein
MGNGTKNSDALKRDPIFRHDEIGVFEIITPGLLDLVTGADSSIVVVGVNSACAIPGADTACVAVNQTCEGARSRNGVCADLNQSCTLGLDSQGNESCYNTLCLNREF